MSVQLEIVSPTRLLLSRAVDMVVLPGYEGDIAAMVNHAPIITLLRGGEIVLWDAGQVTERFFVAGGFAEITPERCTVLADSAVKVSELDVASVQAEREAAEAAYAAVDKNDIISRDAALDRLASAREGVRIAEGK